MFLGWFSHHTSKSVLYFVPSFYTEYIKYCSINSNYTSDYSFSGIQFEFDKCNNKNEQLPDKVRFFVLSHVA